MALGSPRRLARTRKTLREAVERQLLPKQGLSKAEIVECFAAITDDAGTLDLGELLGIDPGGKQRRPDRSS